MPILRLLRFSLLPLIFFLVLAEVVNLSLPRLGPLYRYHLNPFNYYSQIERFDFKDTVRERQCYDGSIDYKSAVSGSIPKIIHMVMVVKEPEVDPSPGQLNFLDWLCITAALKFIEPDQIKLHYTWIDESNMWYKELRNRVEFVHHDLSDIKMIKKSWHPAHIADVMRLQILIREGGIYIDRDVLILRPFNNLLLGHRDTIMGYEGGARGGLCNALILSKKESPFLTRWLSTYDKLDDSVWNYHSVVLPSQLAKQYPDELCELSPTVFFYPTWTSSHLDYMHMRLDTAEERRFAATISANKGGMYKNQLAYHVTHGVARVKELTPELIRQDATPFNILARRVLE